MKTEVSQKKFIVKIQVSLASSDGKSLTLIYDMGRSIEAEFETSKDITRIMKGESKIFSYAHLDEKGGLILDEQAPNQDW